MRGHALVHVAAGIGEEIAPEGGDVLGPDGRIDSLLLIERILAGVVGKLCHDELLDDGIVAAHHIFAARQVDYRLKLGGIAQYHRVKQRLIARSPLLMIARVLQQVQVFARHARLAADEGAAHEGLQHLCAPATLHAILHAPAVAVVVLTVVEVEG